MQELKLETRFIGMLDYLERVCMTAQEVMEDFGVLAQEYAYTIAYVGEEFIGRCFAPVIGHNYKEAVQYTTNFILEEFAQDIKHR